MSSTTLWETLGAMQSLNVALYNCFYSTDMCNPMNNASYKLINTPVHNDPGCFFSLRQEQKIADAHRIRSFSFVLTAVRKNSMIKENAG